MPFFLTNNNTPTLHNLRLQGIQTSATAAVGNKKTPHCLTKTSSFKEPAYAKDDDADADADATADAAADDDDDYDDGPS